MKIAQCTPTHWISLVITVLLLAACGGQSAEQNARRAEALREIGEAYMRQGDYTAAMRELTDALKLNPEDPITHFDLGVCHMTKKRLPDAIASFKRAIALKPGYAPARNNLGTAYLAAKQWDAAISIFKEITQDALYATPHFPLANLGYAYYQKGDYKRALDYYKRSLKVQENFINALRGLGRTYLAMNEGRLALRYLNRAVKIAPKVAEIHYDLAEANLLLGRLPQARVSYETAMELSMPDSETSNKAKQRLDQIR